MPRPKRIFAEGGLYHVYNRLAGGERYFVDEDNALDFVELLRYVAERDDVTVLGWCLMPDRYHLALRMGEVDLDRPMKTLQQRLAHRINARYREAGPLWEERYRTKPIAEGPHLGALLAYIHLSPVTEGLVTDPAGYRWSGHGELIGRSKGPIIDTDAVLGAFGEDRRSARAAYRRCLKDAAEEEWIGEEPGRLPWWRLGRPLKSDHPSPEEALRKKLARSKRGQGSRPRYKAAELVKRCARACRVEPADLRSRSRAAELVRTRELVVLLGVERYRLRVGELAASLGKSASGMSQTLSRAMAKRSTDPSFKRWIDRLDRELAKGR